MKHSEQFARSPQRLAETVARHYLAHILRAQDLAHICEMIRRRAIAPEAMPAVQKLRDEIAARLAEAHLRDLGTPLYPQPHAWQCRVCGGASLSARCPRCEYDYDTCAEVNPPCAP